MSRARRLLEGSKLYRVMQGARRSARYRSWVRCGRPIPPPAAAKYAIIDGIARERGLRVLVETGTYRGDLLYAVDGVFDEMYSIELSRELYERATDRFRGSTRVHIIWGDSGDVMGGLLPKIKVPCLFWLDGHFSGPGTARGHVESPILAELAHISVHPLKRRHVVLIDDARCFNGKGGYPTVEWIEVWARREGFGICEVADDIIRIAERAE